MTKVELPPIVGAKVRAVRSMTLKEMDSQGWCGTPDIVIELDNGILLFASRDPEGNDAGTLFGQYNGTDFYVTPEK